MREIEFIKLNVIFEISNFFANVKVKITSLRTAVRQHANTLTVREFSKWIVVIFLLHFPSLTIMKMVYFLKYYCNVLLLKWNIQPIG
jgi:hypothetical protein